MQTNFSYLPRAPERESKIHSDEVASNRQVNNSEKAIKPRIRQNRRVPYHLPASCMNIQTTAGQKLLPLDTPQAHNVQMVELKYIIHVELLEFNCNQTELVMVEQLVPGQHYLGQFAYIVL